MTSDITGTTFEFCDLHRHGSAFCEFLALRKRFFVDTLNWNIPHDDRVEMDQYDNPRASYSLALQGGRVVGGARIMRFSDEWGPHGCMLRDAGAGRLADIPPSVLPAERDYRRASECTRLVIGDGLQGAARREAALRVIVEGLVDLARRGGSDELVTLTMPVFVRALRRLGYQARQLGDTYHNRQDGRNYAVLGMPAQRAALARPEGRVAAECMQEG